jgi:hypothetical protein
MGVIDLVSEIWGVKNSPEGELVIVVRLQCVSEAGASAFRIVEKNELICVRNYHSHPPISGFHSG